jgi:hypothetical protein
MVLVTFVVLEEGFTVVFVVTFESPFSIVLVELESEGEDLTVVVFYVVWVPFRRETVSVPFLSRVVLVPLESIVTLEPSDSYFVTFPAV